MNFIRSVGAKTLGFIQSLGSITLFFLHILAKSGTAFTRPRLSIRQVYFAGVLSVLIVAVSGLFVGMVLGLQGYTQLAKFKSADILGYMVAASLLRELGPVLAAILFASVDFQRCRYLRRVFGRRRMAGFGRRYFLVANAKQHYLPLRRTQRLNQIRRFRRSRYVNRRTSGLPLRTDFRRYFARQYTHSSVFRPDHPCRRLYVDRVDVYRLKAI